MTLWLWFCSVVLFLLFFRGSFLLFLRLLYLSFLSSCPSLHFLICPFLTTFHHPFLPFFSFSFFLSPPVLTSFYHPCLHFFYSSLSSTLPFTSLSLSSAKFSKVCSRGMNKKVIVLRVSASVVLGQVMSRVGAGQAKVDEGCKERLVVSKLVINSKGFECPSHLG